LLELNGLEEVNKYSLFSLVSSSLLVAKLISVEKTMLAIFLGFNFLLSTLISSKG
jgi:hypothetical protein